MNRRQFLTSTGAASASTLMVGCSSSEESHEVTIKQGFRPSGFGPESTAEQVTNGLDLTGKTILITGCTSGMGFETMRVLALRGAHVIGTGRKLGKAEAACKRISGHCTPMELELTNFDSIIRCADRVSELNIPLDVLICNAGISGRVEKTVVNGIEMAFLVNYVGHFLLVNRLIPTLAKAAAARLVHLSSRSAYNQEPSGGIRFDTLGESNAGLEYSQWDYYGQSKLANALFSFKLAQKYAGLGITSNALHPGLVKTNIGRDQNWLFKNVFRAYQFFAAKTVEQGAATVCYAATHPDLEGVNGQFLEDSNVVTVSGQHHLENQQLADRLWSYTEDLLKGYLL